MLRSCFVLIIALWSLPIWAADGPITAFVNQYCASCHQSDSPSGLNLVDASSQALVSRSEVWERVNRKLSARQMPPEGEPQPSESELNTLIDQLTGPLDTAYMAAPRIPRTESLRRLTRTEYQNSVRDLLGVDIDASSWLPADESSHGFDNVTVSDLSPVWLGRAITAAQRVSHLAVGAIARPAAGETYRVRPDITQEEHVPGLPLGTRGGTLIRAQMARPGLYDITVRLARDRNEEVEGLYDQHQVEILIDKQHVASFTVEPPPGRRDFSVVDKHLIVRTPITAGAHGIGVTFVAKSPSLLETRRQPYHAHYNMHRHPRLGPAVYEVSITGPFADDHGTASNEVRRSLGNPAPDVSATESARRELRALLRLAYRRAIDEEDLAEPLQIFNEHADKGYAIGMEQALASVLVSPHFLFKVERSPAGLASGSNHRLTDFELATRLAYFLWSSLPDEELWQLAAAGELHEPANLQSQVARMLRDVRSRSLAENFAEQWLYLRNLESVTPDLRMYPDFDDNLRQAFRQETRLGFENVLREDRSVLELLRSDTTYLNERLAKHYGIPHIYGSRMRRVDLRELGTASTDPKTDGAKLVDISSNFTLQRGGLLRQGSILTVTSYATRTSPVLRGHWVLKNIVGSPPPPPPANVPALKDNTVDSNQSMRARLAQHREQAACAGCHNLLDPVGFSLENYDAIGRWRELEDGQPIDVAGGLIGGPAFQGVAGLEQALLSRPELFVSTMTEKLLTFALGRGIESADGPAVRRIVKQAAQQDYRFSRLIEAIVMSPPFQLRSVP